MATPKRTTKSKGKARVAPKRKRGQPTLFSAKYVQRAQAICEAGATDRELALELGISERTLNNWKHAHPDFLQALKLGKDAADERVERSLYSRAIGYTFDAEKVMQHNGKAVRAKTVEHVPPDTTAGIFWLKNRRSDRWRDIKAIEHSGAVRLSHASEMSDEQLERIAAGSSAGAAAPSGGSPEPPGVH